MGKRGEVQWYLVGLILAVVVLIAVLWPTLKTSSWFNEKTNFIRDSIGDLIGNIGNFLKFTSEGIEKTSEGSVKDGRTLEQLKAIREKWGSLTDKYLEAEKLNKEGKFEEAADKLIELLDICKKGSIGASDGLLGGTGSFSRITARVTHENSKEKEKVAVEIKCTSEQLRNIRSQLIIAFEGSINKFHSDQNKDKLKSFLSKYEGKFYEFFGVWDIKENPFKWDEIKQKIIGGGYCKLAELHLSSEEYNEAETNARKSISLGYHCNAMLTKTTKAIQDSSRSEQEKTKLKDSLKKLQGLSEELSKGVESREDEKVKSLLAETFDSNDLAIGEFVFKGAYKYDDDNINKLKADILKTVFNYYDGKKSLFPEAYNVYESFKNYKEKINPREFDTIAMDMKDRLGPDFYKAVDLTPIVPPNNEYKITDRTSIYNEGNKYCVSYGGNLLDYTCKEIEPIQSSLSYVDNRYISFKFYPFLEILPFVKGGKNYAWVKVVQYNFGESGISEVTLSENLYGGRGEIERIFLEDSKFKSFSSIFADYDGTSIYLDYASGLPPSSEHSYGSVAWTYDTSPPTPTKSSGVDELPNIIIYHVEYRPGWREQVRVQFEYKP